MEACSRVERASDLRGEAIRSFLANNNADEGELEAIFTDWEESAGSPQNPVESDSDDGDLEG